MIGTGISLNNPQMLIFKRADLEDQQKNLFAYTATPGHPLKSIAASTKRFLERGESRKLQTIQPTDAAWSHPSSNVGPTEHNMALGGLQVELDSYLHEPPVEHYKTVSLGPDLGFGVVWCDPLRYWAVCVFFSSNFTFLT